MFSRNLQLYSGLLTLATQALISGPAHATSPKELKILSQKDAERLDLAVIPHCKIRVGDGCGALDQDEIVSCVSRNFRR
jgi:hypothetical protein